MRPGLRVLFHVLDFVASLTCGRKPHLGSLLLTSLRLRRTVPHTKLRVANFLIVWALVPAKLRPIIATGAIELVFYLRSCGHVRPLRCVKNIVADQKIEIASSSIFRQQVFFDSLSWTQFFRRAPAPS